SAGADAAGPKTTPYRKVTPMIFTAFMLYAYVAGVSTAVAAHTRTRAVAAAALAGLWPLTLPVWAARRAYHRHRPRTATRTADTAPGLPPTTPCTEHHGDDRLRYGCIGPDPAPDAAEPLLTDQTRRLDPLSRALRADVARRSPATPQPYAAALARILDAIDELQASDGDTPGRPGYRSAPNELFLHLYLTAESARTLANDDEAGHG
ncbi:hypothetical protein, partial [Streptomyces phytophilus]|uniref:hypothetical protein n=1 Tax=Streptomyces phytophilus TaxID=722715 RepID=UPI001C6873D3